jgi:hypothetical protein
VKPKTSPLELSLIAACLALVLLALLGPAIAQPADHHHFADQRTLGGIPCAWDVLSNLPFALLGFIGLGWLVARPAMERTQKACAALFFGGLLVTAACSAWYHLQPEDAGLVIDRLGMVFAFAGLLGLAVADRISGRAGLAMAAMVLVLGPLSVQAWAASGNVLAWCVLQFGGMALMLWLATLRPLAGALGLRLCAILLIYSAAKALELADHAVFDFTGHLVSGHTLKHIVASLAALPVMAALKHAKESGQNPAAQPKTKVAPARRLGNA